MKKITVDARLINSAGIGTYLKNLIPPLINKLNNFEFTLLGDKSEIVEALGDYAKTIDIITFSAPIYSLREQILLPLLIPKKTSLFWAPLYNFPLFYNGKIVVTVHDVLHLARKESAFNLVRKIYSKIMFNNLSKKAERIICVSKFTAGELSIYTNINNEKVKIINNGVNNELFEFVSQNPIYPFPYILYVGNVKPHKNILRLIHAFQKLNGSYPHNLVIAGKFEGFLTEYKNIKTQATIKNPKIIFTGKLNDEQIKNLYFHAQALVYPSLYEGFGLPPLEAMACKCPTVVSDIPVLREICGDASVYFNPLNIEEIYQKIKLVLDSADLATSLREKGIAKAKFYDWTNSANILGDVFNNL